MKTLLLWSVIALAEAAFLHIGAIRLLPRLVAWRSVRRLRGYTGRTNVTDYRGLPVAGRGAFTVNPDAAAAFGAYDLGEGHVRVRCAIPPGVACWALALHGWEGENYCVIHAGPAGSPRFDLVIVAPDQGYLAEAGEQVAVSPTRKGLVIVRAILNDRDDQGEVARVERAMRETVMVRNRIPVDPGGQQDVSTGPGAVPTKSRQAETTSV